MDKKPISVIYKIASLVAVLSLIGIAILSFNKNQGLGAIPIILFLVVIGGASTLIFFTGLLRRATNNSPLAYIPLILVLLYSIFLLYKTNNPQVTDPGSIEALVQYASSEKNESYCAQVGVDVKKYECYSMVAKLKKSPALCNNIPDNSELHTACISEAK